MNGLVFDVGASTRFRTSSAAGTPTDSTNAVGHVALTMASILTARKEAHTIPDAEHLRRFLFVRKGFHTFASRYEYSSSTYRSFLLSAESKGDITPSVGVRPILVHNLFKSSPVELV